MEQRHCEFLYARFLQHQNKWNFWFETEYVLFALPPQKKSTVSTSKSAGLVQHEVVFPYVYNNVMVTNTARIFIIGFQRASRHRLGFFFKMSSYWPQAIVISNLESNVDVGTWNSHIPNGATVDVFKVGDVVLGVNEIYLDPLAMLKEFKKFTLLRTTILRTQTTYMERLSVTDFLL